MSAAPSTEARRLPASARVPYAPHGAKTAAVGGEATSQSPLFEGASNVQAGPAANSSIEPGKDHYVRSSGKLIAVLLASLYPTEFDLEKARRDYERGIGATVELSCRRFARASDTDPAGEEGDGA